MQLLLATVLIFTGTVILPKDAFIVPFPPSAPVTEVGNVRVVFTDGHAEMWTKKGDCSSPQVSETGLVGWIKGASTSFPMVRVCWPDGHSKDFGNEESYPNIRSWCFTENNTAVAIEGSWAHGPSHDTEYDLATGKLIAHVTDDGKDLPGWANGLGR